MIERRKGYEKGKAKEKRRRMMQRNGAKGKELQSKREEGKDKKEKGGEERGGRRGEAGRGEKGGSGLLPASRPPCQSDP
jgi:hypothetical protein